MKDPHKNQPGFATRAVHSGNDPDPATGAVSPPIHLTSTFRQEGVDRHLGYDYSRAVNPTRSRWEANLADLEGGARAFAFSSGMAAITALFQCLNAGDHVVVGHNVYGGTHRLIHHVFHRLPLEFTFVDCSDEDHLRQALQANTRLLFLETPTNPLLEVVDIRGIQALVDGRDIWMAVDNTFMSPYGQRPLELGADIVIHSSTKYLGGHSDVLGGALITSHPELIDRLGMIQKSAGAVPSPFDCWLLLRSTKTLALRVQKQADNAHQLARWCAEHPAIEKTIYPGLEHHPQHELASRQQRTPYGESIYGSMISLELGTVARRDRFFSRLKLFTLAESLGGVESLVSNPFVMTHGSIPRAEKEALGITESLVRLSVGVEEVDDLLADLDQALA
ncbi:MAG: PLP-dependent transferase [Candidatus Neomarinimicrobiota bacterium]|nr:MAG: PLP-dependent transferase [Candidatus Neomarinimicrobiota bacterium]